MNVAEPLPPEKLLKQRQVAELLDVSEKTLEGWRVKGGGPKFVKTGSRFVRYRVSDVVQWIEDHTVAHTAEYDVGL